MHKLILFVFLILASFTNAQEECSSQNKVKCADDVKKAYPYCLTAALA